MIFPSRLDIVLSAFPGVETRARAAALIRQGMVSVNGKVIAKASMPVHEYDRVELAGTLPFVGRGGEKLLKALQHFALKVQGQTWIDAGASTGGFTDCLIQQGAAAVYAIDVGSQQLHHSLKNHPAVFSFENTDIRYFNHARFLPSGADGICADLSFISLKGVLPFLMPMLHERGQMILLVKPQFETLPGQKNRRGIVVSEKVRSAALLRVLQSIADCGGKVEDLITTDVANTRKKNTEYLVWIKKKANVVVVDQGI
ncbi:MAG: TlyA family RNA methyltransferase [Bacteroidota bacterium]|jgi:23S rRNA (cytidine1920-2'-O)/16S rRNA (cytidine1409-2'-O)-methyltransferase